MLCRLTSYFNHYPTFDSNRLHDNTMGLKKTHSSKKKKKKKKKSFGKKQEISNKMLLVCFPDLCLLVPFHLHLNCGHLTSLFSSHIKQSSCTDTI